MNSVQQMQIIQHRKQMQYKKRISQQRRKYIVIQLVVFCIISAIIFSLVFLTGNGSLVKSDTSNPIILPKNDAVEVNGKVDNSLLIEELQGEISSSNAILIDYESGEVIAEKKPDERIYPASVTKVMTTLVALEYYDSLDIMIEVPADIFPYLIQQNASCAGFTAGEKVKVIDLLYGIMLPSGADACLTIARSVAGSEEKFAEKMTAKAKELGTVDTNFVNCTGLHDDNHYTTVRDLSKIVKYALENETFKQIFSTEEYTTSVTNKHKYGLTVNSSVFNAIKRAGLTNNYLKGGKTGYTGEARLCLASYAEKNGREYILVTVGAGTPESSRGTHHVKDAIYIYNNYA